MDGKFQDKVVIVAGAARPPGIGFALARRFARSGAAVVCVDAVGEQPSGAYDTGIVAASLLDEVAEEVGGKAVAIGVDPYDPTAWVRTVGETLTRFGRVDIACAFMGNTGPLAGDGALLDVSLDSWRRCYDVNVVSPWLFGQACAADMVARGEGGALCFLSSYSAVVPPAGSGAIASARAALNRIVEVMALELGRHRIRVNAVQPLSVQSGDDRFPNPGLRRMAEGEATSFDSWVHRSLPLGRPQSPDETAAVAEFLCSDEASFVTGVSVPVAGGAHAHS
jgi:NAD(P)-dependent dehydrogenase (short-subunit alcohol dehydrogenase family)